MKVVVTGGSGFIGTNFISMLLDLGIDVVSYDIKAPKNENHLRIWRDIDILNHELLAYTLSIDQPKYIVHLAARTDLNEKKTIDGYKANTDGVRNLMDAACNLDSLKRIIIASSMLVCKLGYSPKSIDDYAPASLYGESKVISEKIVRGYNINWTIVRPTSIWGPWFGEPYKNFFELVVKGVYFNIPSKYSSTKTYGYVENTCKQIYNLLISDCYSVIHNYFYLGDMEPINITDWANRIRKLNNQSKPLTLPIWLLMFAAKIGDVLNSYFGFHKFPLNSFRYSNMTNDNIVNDLHRTIEVTQVGKESNLDDQIIKTLKWLQKK